MKIVVLSDLHLEFLAFEPDQDALRAADVVVLAGDIHPGVEGRRVDDCQEPGFARFDGREIGVNEIAVFLPNWRVLSWTQQEDSDLSHGQWSAEDGDYRIHIYGAPGSSKWHSEVMALWCRFMGD